MNRSRPSSPACPSRPFSVVCLVLAVASLIAFAGCSRGAPKSARAEREAPEAAPSSAAAEPASDVSAAAPAETSEEDSDRFGPAESERDREQKKAKPSLSEPPAEQAPAATSPFEQLEASEDDLAQALDPSALSCTGALPLRDTICKLAERVCALPPGPSLEAAERDCQRARASCTKARDSYATRCGG